MTVDFGELRSAIHSGGTLPDGWMDDERTREYVINHVDLTHISVTVEDVKVSTATLATLDRWGRTATITADQDRVVLLRLHGRDADRFGAWIHNARIEPQDVLKSIQRAILFGRDWPWRT